jgi:hypothetical protein
MTEQALDPAASAAMIADLAATTASKSPGPQPAT